MSAAADALMGIFGFTRVENEMTKTAEEVRRAAFDKWFDSLPWPMCEKCSGDKEIAWRGFNAALDAVEIQLPELESGHENDCGASFDIGCAHNNAIQDCRAAIEQTGLGLRIK